MKFSITKGMFALLLKCTLAWCLILVVLALSISLRYQVPLDFLVNGDDPEVINDFERLMDVKNIGLDILEAFPLLSEIPVIKDVFGSGRNIQSAISGSSDLQRALFNDVVFALMSVAFFKIIFAVYSLICKLSNTLFGKGFISRSADVVSAILFAWLGTISALLLRESFMSNIYNKSDLIAFICIIIAVLAGSFVKALIFNFKRRDKIISEMLETAGKLLLDTLFTAMIYLAWVCTYALTSVELDKGTEITIAIFSIFAILAVTVYGANRFANTFKKS